jgi:uncharacterized cupin superfamily protein
MANIHEPDFDPDEEVHGFFQRRARLGRQAGGDRLGASVYELPPGKAAWPYHAQFANEEMLVVLSGRPTVRTVDGWRELGEGEVMSFVRGSDGAHQVMNRGVSAVRVLIVSEMNAPEVSVYPDSGNVGAFETAPGTPDDDRFEGVFRGDEDVDYWEGEEPPP